MRVAVIQGGPSSEAEVSRVSARSVCDALKKSGHEVETLECDRALPSKLAARSFDVVFPVVHGALGEDGALQGLLELLSLPYVGAGVLASSLANDKVQAKVAFRAAGLPVAKETILHRDVASIDAHGSHAVEAIGHALVVKPATQGSAIGVAPLPDLSGAHDPRLRQALERAFALDEKVLVEAFHVGREVTCGVLELDDDGPRALSPTEILSKAAHWYDFKSRYGTGGSEHVCPARLHEVTTARVVHCAVAAHRALGVRDLSRVDFVVGAGDAEAEVVVLELNTMPGFTATSLFPEAAAVAGISFEVLCDRLVQRAKKRGVRTFEAPEKFPE
jgi:D-alanine-D-alanine ligase